MSDPSFLPGMILTASDAQELSTYGTWTPSLTASTSNPTLGTGSAVSGEYHRNGRLITVWFQISFGTAGVAAGSGNYQIEGLPFPIAVSALGGGTPGWVRLLDSSASQAYAVLTRAQTSTQVLLTRTIEPATLVTNAAPFTWAASDSLTGSFTYLGTT